MLKRKLVVSDGLTLIGCVGISLTLEWQGLGYIGIAVLTLGMLSWLFFSWLASRR